jgi:hypothetical protein
VKVLLPICTENRRERLLPPITPCVDPRGTLREDWSPPTAGMIRGELRLSGQSGILDWPPWLLSLPVEVVLLLVGNLVSPAGLVPHSRSVYIFS